MYTFYIEDHSKGITPVGGGWNLDDDASDDDDLSALTALIDARDETLKNTGKGKSKGNGNGTAITTKSSGDGDKCTVSNKDRKGGVNEPPPPPMAMDSSSSVPTPPPASGRIIEQETLLTEMYESECSTTRATPSNHIDNLLQKYIDETIAHGEEDPNVISLLQQQHSKMCAKKKVIVRAWCFDCHAFQ